MIETHDSLFDSIPMVYGSTCSGKNACYIYGGGSLSDLGTTYLSSIHAENSPVILLWTHCSFGGVSC